jgi:hypothetical protein
VHFRKVILMCAFLTPFGCLGIAMLCLISCTCLDTLSSIVRSSVVRASRSLHVMIPSPGASVSNRYCLSILPFDTRMHIIFYILSTCADLLLQYARLVCVVCKCLLFFFSTSVWFKDTCSINLFPTCLQYGFVCMNLYSHNVCVCLFVRLVVCLFGYLRKTVVSRFWGFSCLFDWGQQNKCWKIIIVCMLPRLTSYFWHQPFC